MCVLIFFCDGDDKNEYLLADDENSLDGRISLFCVLSNENGPNLHYWIHCS